MTGGRVMGVPERVTPRFSYAQPSQPTHGTINFFGTHVGAWEESGTFSPRTTGIDDRYRSLLARLRDHRGFRIREDETVGRLIRRQYHVGRKGDLEFASHVCGRMFQIEFFQNVNVSNPNGGRYDFDKFDRMPRTMQLACAVELSHVLRKLLELGYVLQGRRQGITSAELLPVLRHAQGRTDEGNPLAAFNRSWNFESDWDRGGRFERDESGWPTIDAVNYGRRSPKDRDGNPVVSGAVMYCRHEGRLFRGVVRPVPNDSWVVLSHGREVHKAANELFVCPDLGEPRRLIRGQVKRVRLELEKALRANDFARVEALARVARRLEVSS